jgi:hypothetical protein
MRGRGGAMGDTTTVSVDPIGQLAAQVNRFGAGAPAAYQFTTTPFPVATGILAPDLALAAVLIYQRRATDGFSKFRDATSEALITKANQGLIDPVSFVSANLPEVTSVIAAFADSLGLPAADGGFLMFGLDATALALIAAGGFGLWYMTRKPRRR